MTQALGRIKTAAFTWRRNGGADGKKGGGFYADIRDWFRFPNMQRSLVFLKDAGNQIEAAMIFARTDFVKVL